MSDFLLVTVIALALIFDFVNGFHDAANSIATVVATRVLTPFKAVLWAAFWNFIAFAVLGTEVAKTIAKGVIDQNIISIGVIFAALVGAVFWNVLTAWLGLPSSSSHALIGGMVGAGIAKAGGHVILLEGLKKTGVFIIYSPMVGLALGLVLIILIMWIFSAFKNIKMTNKLFRRMQLVSAAAFSLGHGANDAQKTMGLILALLIGAGKLGSRHADVYSKMKGVELVGVCDILPARAQDTPRRCRTRPFEDYRSLLKLANNPAWTRLLKRSTRPKSNCPSRWPRM